MAANKQMIETMKGVLRKKTTQELKHILNSTDKSDGYFEERKKAVTEILEERANVDGPAQGGETSNTADDKLPDSRLKFTLSDQGYVSTYGTARGIAQFVAFVGWFLVVIGVVVAFLGVVGEAKYRGFSIAAFLPAIGLAVGGLVLVMAGQVTRATVDNADNSGRILHMLRNSGR